MKSSTNNQAALRTSLDKFAAQMSGWENLSDGCLTARVVGEFSAGKTRLLNELLAEWIPAELRPVSSQEVQTRLPLEITYGAPAALQLVERQHDTDRNPTVSRVLTRFPRREEIDSLDAAPERHRLRLSLPIADLVLPEGDGFEDGNTPKRLFLIDMPGWNSGQDDIAEQDAETIMAGPHNLALIYVVSAFRLDSDGNARRLTAFLEALADAMFINGGHLLMVVTHCDLADQPRLQGRAADQVRKLWEQIGMASEDLTLTVQCVEFDQMAPAQLQAFRARFWHALLAPLGGQVKHAHPWTARIRAWPAAWQLAPRVAQATRMVAALHAMLQGSREGGQFLPRMNMRRLDGASQEEIRTKLASEWHGRSQAGRLGQVLAGQEELALPKGHPLAGWWRLCWLQPMGAVIAAAQSFYQDADAAFDMVSAAVPDLEQHLAQHLDISHQDALRAVDGSFARMLAAIEAAGELAPESLLATVLRLGTVQAAFEERCAVHLRQLPERAAP